MWTLNSKLSISTTFILCSGVHESVPDLFEASNESFASSLFHINESWLCHSLSVDAYHLCFAAGDLEACYKIGDTMPYHAIAQLLRNGSPDSEFVLVFNLTSQGLENVVCAEQVGSDEMQLSLLHCFLVCIPFLLVLSFCGNEWSGFTPLFNPINVFHEGSQPLF